MLLGDMLRGEWAFGAGRSPERIKPGVQFELARVRLAHRKFERIISGRRSLPSAEHCRPRLLVGAIERVGRGAHLEEHRVQLELRRAIEKRPQFRFLALCRKPRFGWPIEIVNRRDPHSAKLFRGRRECPRAIPDQGHQRGGKNAGKNAPHAAPRVCSPRRKASEIIPIKSSIKTGLKRTRPSTFSIKSVTRASPLWAVIKTKRSQSCGLIRSTAR